MATQAKSRASVDQRELSVGRDHSMIFIDLSGPRPERILFSPAEARKLLAEIERALNCGFGRDMDAIRTSRR